MKRLVLVLALCASTAAYAGAPDLQLPATSPLAQPTTPKPAEQHATLTDVHSAASFGMYLAGAAIGFVAHESGHIATNLLFGNVPKIAGITTFGFIPFVAIEPRISCGDETCYRHDGTKFGAGRGGKYTIVTAGFDVQHATTEVLLTLHPDLRSMRAPLRKGLVAFDILLSVGYALSSLTGTESDFGDAGTAADVSRLPRVVFAAILLAPAALDTYRFFRPRSRWAPWVSRAAKGAMIGVAFGI